MNTALYFRVKGKVSNTEEDPFLNVTSEGSGNLTEEEPWMEVPVNASQEPLKEVPIGTGFVTPADLPTYHLTYSDNMAIEATALGMVRDGWNGAKCYLLSCFSIGSFSIGSCKKIRELS